MEFEDVAIQFGYSLGSGAAPVKRFRGETVASGKSEFDVAQLISDWWRRSRASRRADTQLPDAAIVAASSVQRAERWAFCAGSAELHALHITDSPISGPDRTSSPRSPLRRLRLRCRYARDRDVIVGKRTPRG